jgi:hypothetical protein
LKEIADCDFQVVDAKSPGIETRAAGRARIDVDGQHLLSVRGREQRLNPRACTEVEGSAKWAARRAVRKIATITTYGHHVIGWNTRIAWMWKVRPSVIGKDQMIADWKQRGARTRTASLIDCEQGSSDKNIAFGPRE